MTEYAELITEEIDITPPEYSIMNDYDTDAYKAMLADTERERNGSCVANL